MYSQLVKLSDIPNEKRGALRAHNSIQ
jgi:predicted metallopeptidase